MIVAPKPENEFERLQALCDYGVLDSGTEEAFDAITRLAASICDVPISIISLIDKDRQWFKSIQGLPGVAETPRDLAFCAHAILSSQLMEIPDALQDERFHDNPLVTGNPCIRFYAGMPLVDSQGFGLGTVCVIDRQPKHLSAFQKAALADLSAVVVKLLENKRSTLSFQKIIEAAPCGIVVANEDGKIAISNDCVTTMLGYSKDELINRPTSLMLHEDDRSRHDLRISQTLNPSKNSHSIGSNIHCRLLHKDGSQIPVQMGLNYLPGRFIVYTMADLAARIHIEKELIQAKEDLQTIIDHMPAMIGYWDSDLRNRFGNKAYLEWFGFTPAEMRGKHIREVIGEKLFALNTPFIQGALRGEPQLFERMILDTAGAHRHTQASYIPDVKGDEVKGFFVLVTDITQRKAAEDALIKERERTMAILEELELSQQAADAANRAKSDFLSHMSHEIRTPLNGLLGMLQVALDDESMTREEQRKTVSIAHRSGKLLLTILNDILDFSKIEAGKMELDEQPFDLKTVIDESIGLLSGAAKDKCIALISEIDANIPINVVGDPTRIRQILINLISNGIKFTQQGNVKVSVSCERSAGNIAKLHFVVSDTGIGIPHEKQTRIFDAFSQADNSITRFYGGTGLGLAICKRLIDLMNGQIWVDSSEGKGSTFHFVISVCESKETKQVESGVKEPVSEKVAPLRPLSILVAEDDSVNQMVITTILNQLGHRVTVVDNGDAAVVKGKSEHYDLFLLDIEMPVMSGFEAATLLRKHHLQVPIIALTAHVVDGIREKCLQAGMNDYISKPISREMLKQKITNSQSNSLIKYDNCSE